MTLNAQIHVQQVSFQQLPELDNGDLSSDSFNVVDSQDTRDFIQSIAKDAHQIEKTKIYMHQL